MASKQERGEFQSSWECLPQSRTSLILQVELGKYPAVACPPSPGKKYFISEVLFVPAYVPLELVSSFYTFGLNVWSCHSVFGHGFSVSSEELKIGCLRLEALVAEELVRLYRQSVFSEFPGGSCLMTNTELLLWGW